MFLERLELKGNTNISLSLSLMHEYPENTGSTHITTFLENFKPRITPRLKSLTAVNRFASWTRLALSILTTKSAKTPKSSSPHLKSLDFGVGNTSPRMVIEGFPALDSVCELTVRRVMMMPSTIPAFSRLEKLEVIGCMTAWSTFLIKLPTISALRHLILTEQRFGSATFGSCPKVVALPNLEILELRRVSVKELDSLIEGLQAGGLTALSFRWPRGEKGGPTDNDEARLVRLLNLSTCIHQLEIEGCEVKDWPKVFRQVPNLLRLRIASCDVGDEDLRQLTKSIRPMYCRQLAELVVDNELACSSAIIRKIVESRNHPPKNNPAAPIHSVTLRGWDSAKVKAADIYAMKKKQKVEVVLDTIDTEDLHRSKGGDSSFTTAGIDDSFATGDRGIALKGEELGFLNV